MQPWISIPLPPDPPAPCGLAVAAAFHRDTARRAVALLHRAGLTRRAQLSAVALEELALARRDHTKCIRLIRRAAERVS
jgi:hypothetical protein